jgi:single-strand DNA-binding protein
MSDIITLTGIVGTEPRALTTQEGLAITSFRLASTQRRFDRASDKWIDGDTNWYTITTFRQLATNAAVSVKKGERILVTGRLRIRNWEAGGKTGVNIDIEADSLGHDLVWGTAAFSRGGGAAPTEAGADAGAGASSGGMSSGEMSTGEMSSGETPGFPTDAEVAAADAGAAQLTPF